MSIDGVLKYRAEIDGLRAVAVFPVVLFHAGIQGFDGGYLGVDIFFVISGYLITSIIINDISQKRFTISGFYERRVRRILPAYIVMILISTIFAWFWMLPIELKNYFESVLASSLFTSNVLFWLESGYFSVGSEEKPLLHTWSLSIEEQYYVFFPLLMLLIGVKSKLRVFVVLLAISIVSISAAEYASQHFPSANFYLLPFRAWELGVGALTATYVMSRGAQANTLMATIGIGLVLGSIIFFNEHTRVPSMIALLPVLGTALIIVFAHSTNWVGKLLSVRLFVFIGLISYSTYLWHQPLLAFARVRVVPSPSDELLAILALSSFACGFLSWRFVEQPFRKKRNYKATSKVMVLTAGAASLMLLALMGGIGHLRQGFPERVPAEALVISEAVYDRSKVEVSETCTFYHARPLTTHPATGCDEFMDGERAEVVFIGDSHSGAIAYDAQVALKQMGISSYSATYSGCIGLRGFERDGMPDGYDCARYNEEMVEFAREAGAKVLVITSRFPLYLSGERFNNQEGGIEHGPSVKFTVVSGIAYDTQKNTDDLFAALLSELLLLSEEFDIVLIDPIPEAGWNVPKVSARQSFYSKSEGNSLSTSLERYFERNERILLVFDEAASASRRIFRVKPHEVLCDPQGTRRCMNSIGSDVFYFDNNHLTRTGARMLVPQLSSAIDLALSTD